MVDQMELQLVLTSVDRMSENVNRSFEALQRQLRRATQQGLTLRNALNSVGDAGRRLTSVGAGLTATGLGLGYLLVGNPLSDAIKIEKSLIDIGNTADLTKSQILELRESLASISKDTNLGQMESLDVLKVASASGISDTKKLIEMTKMAGKVATAESADATDIMKTTYSATETMKIPVKDLARTYDGLAVAGKKGMFELKDMAAHMPSLTAQAKMMGISGREGILQLASALQVARKGAGSSDEAATNFANFLAKMDFNETWNNLKKLEKAGSKGITEQWKAALKAKDPIKELGLLMKDLNAKGINTNKVFSDFQAQKFVNSLVLGLKDYDAIKKKAFSANGTIEKDYQKSLGSTVEQLKKLKNNMDAIVQSKMPAILDKINGILKKINENPLLQKGIFYSLVGIAGAGILLTAIGLAVGSIVWLVNTVLGLRTAVNTARGGWIAFQAAIATRGGFAAAANGGLLLAQTRLAGLGTSITSTVTAMRLWAATNLIGVVPSLGAVTASIGAMTVALLTNPITWAVIGIAAAALLIYKYWKPIKGFFIGLWEGISMSMQPVMLEFKRLWVVVSKELGPAFAWVGPLIKSVGKFLTDLITPCGRVDGAARSTGQTIGIFLGSGLATVIKAIGTLISKLATLYDKIFQVKKAFDALNGLQNAHGIEAVAGGKANATIGQNRVTLAKAGYKTDTSGMITGKYARGGIVKGGLSLVGEEGPELVNLPRGAEVIPNKKTMQMLQPFKNSGGGGGGSVIVNYNPTVTINGSSGNAQQEFLQMLEKHKKEILRMIQTESRVQARLAY